MYTANMVDNKVLRYFVRKVCLECKLFFVIYFLLNLVWFYALRLVGLDLNFTPAAMPGFVLVCLEFFLEIKYALDQMDELAKSVVTKH